jgi:hypothetical protein
MRPTTTEVQELKDLIGSRLDVTEFLDALGWTLYDLVDNMPTEILEEHFEDLLDACG